MTHKTLCVKVGWTNVVLILELVWKSWQFCLGLLPPICSLVYFLFFLDSMPYYLVTLSIKLLFHSPLFLRPHWPNFPELSVIAYNVNVRSVSSNTISYQWNYRFLWSSKPSHRLQYTDKTIPNNIQQSNARTKRLVRLYCGVYLFALNRYCRRTVIWKRNGSVRRLFLIFRLTVYSNVTTMCVAWLMLYTKCPLNSLGTRSAHTQ